MEGPRSLARGPGEIWPREPHNLKVTQWFLSTWGNITRNLIPCFPLASVGRETDKGISNDYCV